MNSHDIFIKNQIFLDEHFNEQRRGLYSRKKLPEEIDEKNSIKFAEEFWLEINDYPLPDGFTNQEKINIFLKLWPEVLELRKKKPAFQFYKQYDVRELRSEILHLDEKYWDSSFKRLKIQNQPIHKHTKIIGNTLFSLDYNGDGRINVIKNDSMPRNIQFKLDKIISELENNFDGKVLISGFTRLAAGDKINIHVDDLYYFKIIKRFQIAISTNSKVSFNIGQETKIFEEGDCYQINNLVGHSITNEGETDRINLLIDILPTNKIKSYNMHY